MKHDQNEKTAKKDSKCRQAKTHKKGTGKKDHNDKTGKLDDELFRTWVKIPSETSETQFRVVM